MTTNATNTAVGADTQLVQARARVEELKAQRTAYYASQGPADPSLARLRPGPLKAHRRTVDAELRREKEMDLAIVRAESRVQTLERLVREQAERDRPKLTAEDLAGARFVRTRFAWHQVVKVNRKTVKIVVEPGMDDLLPISKVLQVVR